jgi:hypothetical protein
LTPLYRGVIIFIEQGKTPKIGVLRVQRITCYSTNSIGSQLKLPKERKALESLSKIQLKISIGVGAPKEREVSVKKPTIFNYR